MRLQAFRRRLAERLRAENLSTDERFELLIALTQLLLGRAGPEEERIRSDVMRGLLRVLGDESEPPMRTHDAMVTALALDYEKARPVALTRFEANLSVSRRTLKEISRRPDGAVELAKRAMAGQTKHELLLDIAIALGTHLESDSSGEIALLYRKVASKACASGKPNSP
jgi:hypothetical protein